MQKSFRFLPLILGTFFAITPSAFSAALKVDDLTLSSSQNISSIAKDSLRRSHESFQPTLYLSQTDLSIVDEQYKVPFGIIASPSYPHLPHKLIEDIHSTQTPDDTKAREHLDKRVKMYRIAQQGTNQLLSDIGLGKEDTPFLSRYFLSGKEFLIPAHVLADHFMGVKTKEDGALALLRLGTTTLNPQLFSDVPDDKRKEREGFAADCYFVVADYCNGKISSLLADLKLLPPHRKHSESAYTTTIDGRKEGLGSVCSLLKMSQWALYRLGGDDHRYNIIYHNVLDLKRNAKHFYESTVLNTPQWHELLTQRNFIGKFAEHITHFGFMSVSESDLTSALLNTGTAMMNDTLDRRALTHFSWETGHPLYQNDLRKIVLHILKTNYNAYYRETVPEYSRLYNNFQSTLGKIEENHKSYLDSLTNDGSESD